MSRTLMLVCVVASVVTVSSAAAEWAAPVAPAIPQADGYVAIPNAAVQPSRSRIYRAIYDATLPAGTPGQILPALNMAGSELNVLVGAGIPARNARFAVVFHGAAVAGILDDRHYRARYRMSNPNLPVLAEMRRQGVELFVCGQYLAAEHIDPATLSPDVKVATDALIVLMAYQNDRYALLSF